MEVLNISSNLLTEAKECRSGPSASTCVIARRKKAQGQQAEYWSHHLHVFRRMTKTLLITPRLFSCMWDDIAPHQVVVRGRSDQGEPAGALAGRANEPFSVAKRLAASLTSTRIPDSWQSYFSFAYSAFACLRMGTSGSASFHSLRKFW